jgi:hypothetical protein
VRGEVQRKPPASGLEKVDEATANIAILMQDFELAFDLHLFLDQGPYRGWQAGTEVGRQGQP